MDKFWDIIAKILTAIQWGLILSIIPCILVAEFMQETGWNPEWAPTFLGRDGGSIVGCVLILIGTFIVWAVKESINNTYVLPRLVEHLRNQPNRKGAKL